MVEIHPRLGYQRNWFWRGWQIRYSYLRPQQGKNLDRPPLLLLHGFGAALGHWRHNFQALSQHHGVYAIDLLGFGGSEKAAAPYNPKLWAELVYDFWQTFIGEPMVLVGNSLGSVVCLTTAKRYPQVAKGLVMLNLPDASVVTPVITPPISSGISQVLQGFLSPLTTLLQAIFTSPLVINPLLKIVRSPGILYPALGNAYGDKTAVDDELKAIIRQGAYDRNAAQALRFLTRGMGQIPQGDRARTVLPQMSIPMLLIWGKADRLVPPQLGPRCAQLNPRLKLVELEGVGHCPQDECPDRVNTLILDWLQNWDREDFGP
jgi:pimeloyl-ACP methyl ester carboxylesterase